MSENNTTTKATFTEAQRVQIVKRYFALKKAKYSREEIATQFNTEFPRSNGTEWTEGYLSSFASNYKTVHPRLHRKLKTTARHEDPAQITFDEVIQEPVFPTTTDTNTNTKTYTNTYTNTFTTDAAVNVLEKITATTTFTREEKRLLMAAVIGKSYADGTNQQTTRN